MSDMFSEFDALAVKKNLKISAEMYWIEKQSGQILFPTKYTEIFLIFFHTAMRHFFVHKDIGIFNSHIPGRRAINIILEEMSVNIQMSIRLYTVHWSIIKHNVSLMYGPSTL